MNEENDEQTPEEETPATEPEATGETLAEETAEPAQEEAPAESEEPEPKAEEPEIKAEEPEAKAEEPEAKAEEPEAKAEEPKPKAEAEPTAEEPAESEEEAAPVKKEETAEDLLKSELSEVKIRRAKGSKNITHGIVHVTATFNNTKVNITDMRGNTISWSSSGKCNFRGSRKSTAYAAQVVTNDAGRAAMAHGLKEVVVKVCGPGMGRDSAVRALQSLGLIVTSLVDVTPVPHNGCRPPKRRRV
jgi:small subunit ribosomal protein S11